MVTMQTARNGTLLIRRLVKGTLSPVTTKQTGLWKTIEHERKVIKMVGKTFRSKINGKVFQVVDLFKDGDFWCYKILDVATGDTLTATKRVFEEMCLANLEIIEGEHHEIRNQL